MIRMMGKTDQLRAIRTERRNGLILLTKNLLKYFLIVKEPHGSEYIDLTNDRLTSIINCDDFKNFVKSISNLGTIKNFIPLFVIESYCRTFIEDLLKENISDDETIGKNIDHLLEDLEVRIDEWDVIIPLENVALDGLDCIEIGGVELLHPNKIKEIFYNEKIFNNFGDVTEIQDKVGACIKIKTDFQEVYDSALLKVEPIINILRIYAYYNPHVIFNSPWPIIKAKIGPCGAINLATRHIISYQPGKGWGARSSGIGPIPKLIIDNDFLDEIEKNYEFIQIKNILRKETPSKYERQILLAIRWLGLGIDDDIETDKLIKFSVALECLVLTRDDKTKSEALAERCACILGNSSEERRKVYDNVKHFYDLRGDIVHDGMDSINKVYVYEFRELVTKCLFKLLEINNKYHLMDTKQLKELIQSKKSEAITQYRSDKNWFESGSD